MKTKNDERDKIIGAFCKMINELDESGIEGDYCTYIIFMLCGRILAKEIGSVRLMECVNEILNDLS